MKNGLEGFFTTFWLIVLIHGAYDLLLTAPELADARLFSITTYIALCYMFFNRFRAFREPGRSVLSLKATFLGGVSLLFAVTLVVVSADIGFGFALMALVGSVMELVLIAYMFVREMGDH